MERSTIIASVIAGAGILIAGSVAGTAAINAATSSQVETPADQVIAAPALASSDLELIPAGTPEVTLPEFSQEPLPPLMSPDDPFSPAPAPKSRKPSAKTAGKATARVGATAAAEPTAPTVPSSASDAPATLSREQATALVVAAVGGGTAQGASQVGHGGYDTWAVTVLRPDGSVVTGFVDQASGVIVDWRLDQAAPTPRSTPAPDAYAGDDDREEYEDESDSDELENEGDVDDD